MLRRCSVQCTSSSSSNVPAGARTKIKLSGLTPRVCPSMLSLTPQRPFSSSNALSSPWHPVFEMRERVHLGWAQTNRCAAGRHAAAANLPLCCGAPLSPVILTVHPVLSSFPCSRATLPWSAVICPVDIGKRARAEQYFGGKARRSGDGRTRREGGEEKRETAGRRRWGGAAQRRGSGGAVRRCAPPT